MRCFIGIPLPQNVRACLIRAQQCFRGVDARMSVVKGDNLHVTLYFLGDVDDVFKIKEGLGEVRFDSFTASVKDLSFFPKQSYIRVIHSPVNKGAGEVRALRDKIIDVLGLDSGQRFSPHVTLARVKFVKSTNALARACFDERFEVDFRVDGFNLYSSNLTPQGPVYEVLQSYDSSNP